MRMTVGPLPPAVYWRRRAAVLGAVLLALVVLLWSCTGGTDEPGKTPGATGSPTAAPAQEITPNPSETAAPGDAAGQPPAGDPGGDSAPGNTAPAPGNVPAGQQTPASTGAAAAGTGPCADAEILVTPVPLPATTRRGQTVDLRLKIKNVSARTCSRDIGADVQEIYIKQGALKIWSSDRCSTARGADLQRFTPGLEKEGRVSWNGRDMTRCASGQAAGAVPPAGEYQLFGRLGSRHSNPVKLVLLG